MGDEERRVLTLERSIGEEHGAQLGYAMMEGGSHGESCFSTYFKSAPSKLAL